MNREFEAGTIEEVLNQIRQVIRDTEKVISRLKSTADRIAGAAGQVPAEARTGLEGTASGLGGKLTKDIYDEVLTKIDAVRERACSLIPADDADMAAQIQGITADTRSLLSVLDELRQFILETPLTTDYSSFNRLLDAKEKKWKKTLEDVEDDLSVVLGNTKGAEAISTEFSKDPVNLNTGNFIFDQTDLRISGTPEFLLRRFYNSLGDFQGMLGRDWNLNFEVHLTFRKSRIFARDEIFLFREDGKQEEFLPVDEKTYTPGNQSLGILRALDNGYEYTSLQGDKWMFDEKGRYTRFENSNGFGFRLRYAPAGDPEKGERLAEVRRDSGEFFRFRYDETTGFLLSVCDHTGREWHYEIRDGLLQKAVRTDGGTYTYTYDASEKLASVENPEHVLQIVNEFDGSGRTILQKFPDGTSMRYDYSDDAREIRMTERNGAVSTHVHDEKYRNIKNIYPNGEEVFDYNDRNQKTRITDRRGFTTRLKYDNRGNLTGILNPLGVSASLTYNSMNRIQAVSIDGITRLSNRYDARGNMLSQKDALGNRTDFSYDRDGRMTQIRRADGSVIGVAYDVRGNIASVTDENGNRTAYEYDDLNRVCRVTDPCDAVWQFAYDDNDNIVSETNPEGRTRRYTYNRNNQVTGIEDYDGTRIAREYNAIGKPEKMTDQGGRETVLKYDSMWNVAKIIRPDGAVTKYIYDENNQLSRVRDVAGNVTRYTNDPNGNRTSEQDAEGNVTRYTYDALDRLVKVTAPDGSGEDFVYDAAGNIIRAADALGNEVLLTYNAAGQLLRESNSFGESRIYTYTVLGDVETITDENGLVTTYRYLPGGRNVTEIDHGNGRKETYTYDPNGRPRTFTDNAGYTITYSYDPLGNVRSITGEEGESRSYTYDAVGNVLTMTDANGGVTHYEYSFTGQLTKVVDPLGNETDYTYDALDQLSSVIKRGEGEENPARITRYEYDRLGRVTAVTDPLGRQERYTYSKTGQLIEKFDKDGFLTRYRYTSRGDLAGIQYGDGRAVEYSYNALRQLEQIKDWNGTTTIQNNGKGQAVQVFYPDGRQIRCTYAPDGRRTSLTYPDGRTARYDYNESRFLSAVRIPAKSGDGQEEINYSYDARGRLAEKRLPGEVCARYTYDRRGLLSSVRSSDAQGILDASEFQYDRDANPVVIDRTRRGLEEQTGTFTYGYDALGRLESVRRNQVPLRTYEYDAFGNRTRMTELGGQKKVTSYSYNLLDQLVLLESGEMRKTFAYDGRGNLTGISKNGKTAAAYTYGSLNRLEKAVNGTETAEYLYNGIGHRIGKTVQREDGQGFRKQITYLTDLSRDYNNLLVKKEDSEVQQFYWDGAAAAFDTDRENPEFYLNDELGSPKRTTGLFGEVSGTWAFDEFGVPLAASTRTSQPFGFTGYQYDTAAESYFAQYRQYSAETGTFLARDYYPGALEDPLSLHAYLYCEDNPKKYKDEDGRWFHIVVGAAVGFGVNAVVELGTQLIMRKPIDFKSVFAAGVGGAVEGAITTAFPLAPKPVAAVAGGAVKRLTSGLMHGEDADKILTDVGTGAVADFAFSKVEEWIGGTSVVKKLKGSVRSTAIGKTFFYAENSYKSVISRARNAFQRGSAIHITWKTVRNGLKGELGKKIFKKLTDPAFYLQAFSGIDSKKEVQKLEENLFTTGLNQLGQALCSNTVNQAVPC